MKAYFFGFTSAELAQIPETIEWLLPLHPENIRELQNVPLIVHSRTLPINPTQHLTMILYLPQGERAEESDLKGFDAVVHEGQWENLMDLLSCPLLFTLPAEVFRDLPALWLQEHGDRFSETSVGEIPIEDDENALHLFECHFCRQALNHLVAIR
jgi:hypothetical protein